MSLIIRILEARYHRGTNIQQQLKLIKKLGFSGIWGIGYDPSGRISCRSDVWDEALGMGPGSNPGPREWRLAAHQHVTILLQNVSDLWQHRP